MEKGYTVKLGWYTETDVQGGWGWALRECERVQEKERETFQGHFRKTHHRSQKERRIKVKKIYKKITGSQSWWKCTISLIKAWRTLIVHNMNSCMFCRLLFRYHTVCSMLIFQGQ